MPNPDSRRSKEKSPGGSRRCYVGVRKEIINGDVTYGEARIADMRAKE